MEAKKYMIVKTSSLGDIVQAFTAVCYLKIKTGGRIDWVVERRFQDIVKACPFVDRVIPFDSKIWRKNPLNKEVWKEVREFIQSLKLKEYDALFDLQGNIKSGMIDFFCRTKYKVGFSKANVSEGLNTFFTNFHTEIAPLQNVRDDMLALVQSYFNDKKPFVLPEITLSATLEEQGKINEILSHTNLQGRKRLCISPFSAWKSKEVDIKEFGTFLSKIQKRFDLSYVFLYGTEEERLKALGLAFQFPTTSVVAERLNPAALQGLMRLADGVIAMDSFPLHLAGTTRTPVFSFFGPSLGIRYAPKGAEKAFVQGTCPYGIKFDRRCPKLRTCETGACLKQLKADPLDAKFATWWQALNL